MSNVLPSVTVGFDEYDRPVLKCSFCRHPAARADPVVLGLPGSAWILLHHPGCPINLAEAAKASLAKERERVRVLRESMKHQRSMAARWRDESIVLGLVAASKWFDALLDAAVHALTETEEASGDE